MPDIAFLIGDIRLARHDNHRRLPRAFAAAGWWVSEIPHEALHLTPSGLRLGDHDPARFDLLWLLGMGPADNFLDRMQLLRQLPQERCVVPVDALVYWHAKYAWWAHMPPTYASRDAEFLKARLAAGGDWVIKPGAGSFGRDVLRISAGAAGSAAIDRLTDRGRRYAVLQRYASEIEQGEKRTLVAGGRLVGSYLRRAEGDLRSNLAVGGTPHPTTLSAGERELVTGLAGDLERRGVGFAAVDVAYPYLIEVNLANPGGLATLEALYGSDPTPHVVEAIVRSRGF
ncbi:MAG: hypothetical protein RIC56_13760 [Pseudomonadales bacterium]